MKSQARPNGAWERSLRYGPGRIFRRLTLRRADGQVYLDRWGLAHDRVGGVLLHRMSAPDPGVDLHDHPWTFLSIILRGGYIEERALIREAPLFAQIKEKAEAAAGHRLPLTCRGVVEERRLGSFRVMRLDECHTVVALKRKTSWSLVVKGPRRRSWGFYLAEGYMSERQYDETVRAERRDLWSDQNAERPW